MNNRNVCPNGHAYYGPECPYCKHLPEEPKEEKPKCEEVEDGE
jgi:glutaredoxin